MVGEAQSFRGLPVNGRGATDVWLTPPPIIDALGGPESFDLDPASPANRPWPTARAHYTEAENGLLLPWRGRVWLNPPYSNPLLGKFLARMADHGRGVSLIFARTETEAFRRFVWESASGLLFLFGRLNFYREDGTPGSANSGAPSVLCAYGIEEAERLASSGLEGAFVPLRLPRYVAAMALSITWSEAVVEMVRASGSDTIKVEDLYRAFADHPKARANNHVRAKLRQVLQRGPFRRVRRGEWALV